MIRLALRRLFTRLLALIGRDAVSFDGQVLPPRRLRFCGANFKDDAHFLASARGEAERLIERCGLGHGSRVLDVGCGPGRLAIGIQSRLGTLAGYLGLDVDPTSVDWCRRHLAPRDQAFRFVHLDLANARYNPGGERIGRGLRFPVGEERFDVIYLYSVFSHMGLEDVRAYLHEFARVLAPGGTVFLTGFFESGVEDVAENPDGYRLEWKGPLHGVRYERGFFEGLVAEAGLAVAGFDYGQETDGQSAYYLHRS